MFSGRLLHCQLRGCIRGTGKIPAPRFKIISPVLLCERDFYGVESAIALHVFGSERQDIVRRGLRQPRKSVRQVVAIVKKLASGALRKLRQHIAASKLARGFHVTRGLIRARIGRRSRRA